MAVPSSLRNGTTLVTLHPPAQVFVCTEDNCDTAFRATTWTSMKRSLERHLADIHSIDLLDSVNTCRNCQQDLGKRPTRHNCPQPDQQPAEPSPVLKWKCTTCTMSFPSNLGLRNHIRQHQRAARELEVRQQLPTPRTRRRMRVIRRRDRSSSSSPSDDDGGPPVPSGASTTSSDAFAMPALSPVRQPTPPAPMSPVYASDHSTPVNSPRRLTPMAGSTTASSPAPSTIRDASLDSELLTQDVPNNPSPAPSSRPETQQLDDNVIIPNDVNPDQSILDEYEPTILEILESDTTDANWVRFTLTLDHITTFLQTHFKINTTTTRTDNNNNPTNSNQPIAANHTKIQKLYRRNRRRAIREILGESRPTCPADADELLDHFTTSWSASNYQPGAYNILPPTHRAPLVLNPFTIEETRTLQAGPPGRFFHPRCCGAGPPWRNRNPSPPLGAEFGPSGSNLHNHCPLRTGLRTLSRFAGHCLSPPHLRGDQPGLRTSAPPRANSSPFIELPRWCFVK